jgi:hypothetical protein
MRSALPHFAFLIALIVNGCSQGEPNTEMDLSKQDGLNVDAGGDNPAEANLNIGTPMGERVATLGLLNKRNNSTQDITLTPGESRIFGEVKIGLSACERTAPWEMVRETGAFIQVDVQNRGSSEFERIFSGWVFKESPSLNVVEHPIYDVWIKDCNMNFPGEE